MKKMLSVLALSVLRVLVKAEKIEKEVDLYFHQNDYQIKFERIELIRYNKDLVQEAKVVTFKYNRTTTLANATFTLKADLGYDMVSTVQVYKFMSNEYRTFPLRMAANGCKAIAADVAGMGDFTKCGNFTGCPGLKGRKYHICNWRPDESKLPPFIPNGQYMLQVQVTIGNTEVGVGNGYATVSRPLV